MNRSLGISRGIPPERHLESVLGDVTDLKAAVQALSFLRGPLHLASPLRIGDLEIIVRPNRMNPASIDVLFNNVKTESQPVVVWTIA